LKTSKVDSETSENMGYMSTNDTNRLLDDMFPQSGDDS